MNRNLILAVVALVGIAAAAWFLTQNGPQETAIVQSVQAESSNVDTSGVQDMTLGDPEAPITFIEYASFTCPHCASFHAGAFKDLKADFIDTGKVKFVMREVYFDRYGLWAGMVARCGDGVRYFGIIDLLFEKQQEWTQGEPAQIAANLKQIGKLAGMDDATLDACLQDAAKAEALNAFYQKNATADGIRATPSFVINGELVSNESYAELKARLDGLLN